MNDQNNSDCGLADKPGDAGAGLRLRMQGRAISFFEFVALIAFLMALTALSIDIMLPALPQIGAVFSISNANNQQAIVTCYLLGFAVGQLLYGPLSDHVGRKPVLLAGLAIFIIGTIGALAAGGFGWLLAACKALARRRRGWWRSRSCAIASAAVTWRGSCPS